ncbi:HAMP domain-containing protein [bacterium]|nr:HAMP domain-containing protein [bacterium]
MRTLTPFIITLYVSFICLGWAAIKIITDQNEVKIEHILSVESNKILYFYEAERKQILEAFQIIEKWWKKTGQIPPLNFDFPLSIKLVPLAQSLEKPTEKPRFSWNIKNVDRVNYFEGIAQKIVTIRPGQTINLVVSRRIYPYINRYLRSNVEWLIYDEHGKMLGTSSYYSTILKKNELGVVSAKLGLSQEQLTQLLVEDRGITRRVNLDESYQIYYFALRDQDEAHVIIGLIYSLTQDNLVLKTFTLLTIAILTLVSVMLTAFYYLANQKMNRYLAGLKEFTSKVSEGDFSKRLEDKEDDDFQHLNEQLNQMTDSLSKMKNIEQNLMVLDRLSSLAQLSIGIAHEIKNPLMVLKYSLNHIKKNIRDDAFSDDFEMLEKNTSRIEQVVQRLADFSRPATIEDREVCDLTIVLQDALYFLRKAMEIKNIRLDFPADPPVLSARIQKNALNQVFTNILLNAIEAMPTGGSIAISLSDTTGLTDEHTAVISFSDSGTGIRYEDYTKIFNPFFSTKDKGTGLGLAIAYKIVTDHDGSILIRPRCQATTSSVLSQSGPDLVPDEIKDCLGTEVIITLPLEKNSPGM